MARPFTRAQALENQAFLALLRQTGNARAAARTLGLHRAKFTRRRAAHPAFAAEWDAALALAQAALNAARAPGGPSKAKADDRQLVRLKSGRLQLRRADPRSVTPRAQQAFLAALGATANIRLAAAAAGHSHAAFYDLRRRDRGFAREMRLALQAGYDRLELALLESGTVAAHEHDHWRHNDPPDMPPMTPAEALQLLYLHQKEARLLAEPPHLKRRRGESKEAWSFRLSVMYEMGLARDREAFEIAEAARRAEEDGGGPEPAAPLLPDLSQVSGWSTR